MPSSNQDSNVRIKICGITSVDDGIAAATLGADAIGLVFYKPSPRYVELAMAANIAAAVGPFVTVTGLFVDATQDQVQQVLKQVPLHILQFHGDESAAFCEQFNRPYIKAIRVSEGMDVGSAITAYPSASGILLDTYRKGVPGGTGETFNWQQVPQSSPFPVILAGGLNPDNVATAIKQTRPYGVDVSGGVERETENKTGQKDHQKIAAFIKAARGVLM